MTANLTEDAIWQASFPYFFAFARQQGAYDIPDRDMMLRALQSGFALTGARSNAVLRLDMAIASLWPHIVNKFASPHFQHRLAAATDILRAVDFGDDQPAVIAELARELTDALEALEQVLARLAKDAAGEPGQQAAQKPER